MKTLLTVVICSAALTIAATASAQVSFNIRIGPPPSPPEVVVAAPFFGAVWAPGYYIFDYSVNQYRWQPGVWMHPPFARAVWVAPRYVLRGNDYGYVAGYWAPPARDHNRAYYRGHVDEWHGGRFIRPGRAPMGW